MVVGAIVGVCVLLFVLALLAPRLSRKPQRGVDRTLTAGESVAGTAPGKAGRWLAKPFSTSRKAADKSAGAGRKSRFKLPF